MTKSSAYLFGDRLVIFSIDDAKRIYSKSFFGKPLGNPKPKGAEDINRALELSLIEGLYLLRKGEIEVIHEEKLLSEEEFMKYAKLAIPRFDILFTVYNDLREKGFVVRSGIKFGADFAIYTLGPGMEHAPYVVICLDANSSITANQLMSFGRVSHSTRKKLILAMTNAKIGSVKYIMFKWVKL
ncbi:tRNA-intron lyase [Acidianus sp. RZ1]|uniref:tRNA-intron lyase n=1 Tax=Acidianus sp. RZ1 TaxID=1540082 RepID=UPI001490E897|nr:tRNA-intron lyase [Acidianus sp. RZ1]NON62203.1 tRNA-intron lyase [Acidianus sp. RZ1]